MNSLGQGFAWGTGVGGNYGISGGSIFFSLCLAGRCFMKYYSRPEVFYEIAFIKYFVNFSIFTMSRASLQIFSSGFQKFFEANFLWTPAYVAYWLNMSQYIVVYNDAVYNIITVYHNRASDIVWINKVRVTVLIIKNSLWKEIKYTCLKSVIIFVL